MINLRSFHAEASRNEIGCQPSSSTLFMVIKAHSELPNERTVKTPVMGA